MSDTVRFLHTADLHLDSPLSSLAARNAELSEIIQDASRHVLRRMVDTALHEQVDAVIIAGDLFDGDQRDVTTAMVLQRELRRLDAVHIPVFIIWGNHDAEARLLGILDFPANVHAFSDKGGTQYFADDKAAIHGVSFSKRSSPESLLSKYPAPVAGCLNVGMLHTSLTGSDGHNDYAPCTVDQLVDMGYDYWALGHIHKRCVHHEQPAIVMPGNPLGRHINESGSRTVSIVELAHNKPAHITPVELAPVRFERVLIALDDVQTRTDARDLMLQAIEQCRNSTQVAHLIVRVKLTGFSDLATVYAQHKEALFTELQTEYEHREDLWIDSVDIRSLQPTARDNSTSHKRSDDGSVTELLSLVGDHLIDTANLQDAVREDLNKLSRALPGELNELFRFDSDEQYQLWIRSSADWMMQHLEESDTDASEDESA